MMETKAFNDSCFEGKFLGDKNLRLTKLNNAVITETRKNNYYYATTQMRTIFPND